MCALELDKETPDSQSRFNGGKERERRRRGRSAFPSSPSTEAPRRRDNGGSPSWAAATHTPGSSQAFTSEVSACRYGGRTRWDLSGTRRCFLRAGEAGAGEAGALRSAKVGDELVFARKGRELFLWLAKTRKKRKRQG